MIKKCSIMQPHFFPWSGYFNLINKCDIFIFLDDVQFSKNSWQVRNKLFVNKSIKWITVPTKKSSLKNTKINEKIMHNRYHMDFAPFRSTSGLLEDFCENPYFAASKLPLKLKRKTCPF